MELIEGLAAILQLTISGYKKTAIQKDSGICKVLMVKGAGSRTLDLIALLKTSPKLCLLFTSSIEDYPNSFLVQVEKIL